MVGVKVVPDFSEEWFGQNEVGRFQREHIIALHSLLLKIVQQLP